MATIVESDSKVVISITITPKNKGGRYSFPWIAPLYPWYVPYNECWVLSKVASSTIFWVFIMTWPGIELRSTGPLPSTLTSRPMSQSKDKLVTLAEGDSKTPFSITTTPRCRARLHSLDCSTLPLILTL